MKKISQQKYSVSSLQAAFERSFVRSFFNTRPDWTKCNLCKKRRFKPGHADNLYVTCIKKNSLKWLRNITYCAKLSNTT